MHNLDSFVYYDSNDSLPSPQEDFSYLRWGTSWGKTNFDFAEDVWADEYYVYMVGTLDANTSDPKLSLVRYSEWNGGLQDWNVTWSNGTPTYGKAVWSNGIDIYTGAISSNDFILIKWQRDDGTQIWNSTWNLSSNFGDIHSIWGIDDFIYMSGVYIDDLLLIKWDFDGNQIWNRTWGGSGWEEGFDIWGIDGNVYTVGSTSSFGSGLNDSVIIKWDLDGNQVWNHTWGYATDEYYTSIFGFNTSLYVCGNVWNDYHTKTDAVVQKWDSNGTVLWNRWWGGPEDERAYAIWANEFYVYVSTTVSSWGLFCDKLVLAKWSYSGIYVDSSWPYWDNEYQYIPSGMFVFNQNVYVSGWYNGSQDNIGDYDQLLFNFYSYFSPPFPWFEPISPNPSINGTYLLEWQYFPEVENYYLYRDIHPILNISGRTPYKILTNTNFTESGMEEGTYFYVVTSVLKNIESSISNPRIVVVDLPDPPNRRIPGYSLYSLIGIILLSIFVLYARERRKNLIN